MMTLIFVSYIILLAVSTAIFLYLSHRIDKCKPKIDPFNVFDYEQKFIDSIEGREWIESQINDLNIKVYKLENPAMYKKGDMFKFDSGVFTIIGNPTFNQYRKVWIYDLVNKKNDSFKFGEDEILKKIK